MHTPKEIEKKLLTVKGVATYLELKPSTIYSYVHERRIPYIKLPGSQQVRFDLDEIDAWAKQGRVETKDEALERVGRERK